MHVIVGTIFAFGEQHLVLARSLHALAPTAAACLLVVCKTGQNIYYLEHISTEARHDTFCLIISNLYWPGRSSSHLPWDL